MSVKIAKSARIETRYTETEDGTKVFRGHQLILDDEEFPYDYLLDPGLKVLDLNPGQAGGPFYGVQVTIAVDGPVEGLHLAEQGVYEFEGRDL